MNAMVVNARVEGPLKWLDEPSVFSHPLGDKKGVYVWTVPVDNRHVVHYVGMTDASFSYRMRQHHKDYLSGMYFIFDPAYLRQGELSEIWRGMATPGQEVRGDEFRARADTLRPAIDQTLEMMSLWLIPLDLRRREIERIEGAIARHLRAHPEESKHLIEAPVAFPNRSPSESPFDVCLTFSEELLGVPSSFTA